MKKINFNQRLKDAFSKEVVVNDKNGTAKPVLIHEDLVSIISHPQATPENTQLSQMQILNRMKLTMKIADGKTAEYDDDELSIIRDATLSLYNAKIITLSLAGGILSLIETK